MRIEVAEASFRRLRATSVAQQQQATAYVEMVWELSRYLEEFVEFPRSTYPPGHAQTHTIHLTPQRPPATSERTGALEPSPSPTSSTNSSSTES